MNRTGIARRLVVWALRLLAGFACAAASPAIAATCAQATTQGTAPPAWQTYCWLDLSTYNDTTARTAAGQSFSYALSDGAVLTFTVKTTATSPAMTSITAPSWTGAAVGNTAFLGIPGRPIIYQQGAGTTNITFSNIMITPPPGAPAVTAYAFVAADAESTNQGESLTFTTNGGAWTLLDQVDPISGTSYPTITGLSTSTFTETGVTGTVGGYIVGSTSPTTVTATLVGGGLQGAMFAVRFASMRLTKVISGARIDPADQFKFDIGATSTGTVLATGTTTGTGNGPFTAAAVSLASGIPLTISETMATGSVNLLSRYQSRLTCVNGATGSTTIVPTNLATTSYSFGTLQFGDAIQCTFTNTAFPNIRLQKALGAGGRQFDTDQFLVSISNGPAALASATTSGTGATVTGGATPMTPVAVGTAYVLNESAAGTTSFLQYTASLSCINAATGSSTVLPTVIGGTITLQMGDVVTCTITNTKRAANATLTIVKSSTLLSDPKNGTTNPKAIPGAIVRYSLVVTNTGTLTVDSNSIFMIDSLPASLSVGTAATPVFIQGTPTSTLALPAANVRYSNAAAAPTTVAGCTYTPVLAYDPAVKHVCIAPTGTMAAATAAGQPSFTVTFNAQIK
jgi:Surface adhesin CshA non-repetitive domain 2